MVVLYLPTHDVRNLGILPHGTGAKYLLCLNGPNGELIAKRWKREPVEVSASETLLCFGTTAYKAAQRANR